ncbi:hypothetical protein DPMN_000970 [Dreissena polymorpha]|uniref:Uncharacterized protein n=1 Tax=Dreissena polymorpha TaxID=45954 RepID=A0A9D4RPY9_DREPO|nr:hypothetical protein DPMN_000968 [Dreissena polymorpha]KAH3877113.1 hypothetical protein DPMN_000970 [Dreissena polymorpha]
MEWLDVSVEEEVVTTAKHDPKRTVDMAMRIITIKLNSRLGQRKRLKSKIHIKDDS